MLCLDKQKCAPITTYVGINRGLGQIDVGSIITDSVDSVQNAADSYLNNLNFSFGGSGHPWIPAQNDAADKLATIVSNYVSVKQAGRLTSSYINTAINEVDTVVKGFAKFTSQYSDPGAQRGLNDISSNANEIKANMRYDFTQLPYSVTNVLNTVGDTVSQYTGLSTSTLLLCAGILLFMRKGRII